MVVTKGWVEYRMFIYYLKHEGFSFARWWNINVNALHASEL